MLVAPELMDKLAAAVVAHRATEDADLASQTKLLEAERANEVARAAEDAAYTELKALVTDLYSAVTKKDPTPVAVAVDPPSIAGVTDLPSLPLAAEPVSPPVPL